MFYKGKKLTSILVVALMLSMVFAGCTKPTAVEPDILKPVILVVSFGTSYNDSRDITIGAVEKAIEKAYPAYDVRRAFTSQIIIDILAEREGLEIDNIEQAMDKLVADGVKEVIVQPTHIMNGFEYDDVVAEVTAYADKFDKLVIGKNLLTTDEDYNDVIRIVTEETADCVSDGTAMVFMGHGTEHASNATYAKLQEMITAAGYTNYFVGTVESTPTVEDVIASVKAGGFTKVVLEPLMIVAGDHANNDMASDEEDSWKTLFTEAGFEVDCVIKGLGQFEGIQQLIVKHTQESIDSIV